jgi:hypothetical protein
MTRKLTRYLGHHHLALIALFVALGGTSYATTSKLLPANSVGTAQVINGSIRRACWTGRHSGASRSAGSAGSAGGAGTEG